MPTQSISTFTSVYGPVKSWRYGTSLGIDPIGSVSTCSFNCVYCQLGEIQIRTNQRQIFVPTEQIICDLQPFAPWDVDVITLSGNGEPTLALNLGEIIAQIKQITHKPVLVLTNGTLLIDPRVRTALSLADRVSVKVDAVFPEQLRRINRPIVEFNWQQVWQGIQQFRQDYKGEIGIQTMLLTSWDERSKQRYIELMRSLQPDEIQLNTPTRAKPLTHQLEARGNHTNADSLPYPVQILKQVSSDILQTFAEEIYDSTKILVRCAPHLVNS
ncbi:MAG TPA: radical SAM protein [Cyanobacteria bacterium UBA12227]|nr:radical SAM protein [Cyanobacteria bacterium UBA12227]HAX90330.1 radical SAM protein [Cyanobacteria bacterium UBA11370]HBY78668.1 radical SAM protein [Cyanobacteria bacterium UBA11148]